MKGRPYHSCLTPYEAEIVALRRKKPPVSYSDIAKLLNEKYQVIVRRETIHSFMEVRAKRSLIAGFWEAKEIDNGKFLKLYVNGIKAFAELTSPGAKVFEVLYRKMQDSIEKDQVYMSYAAVDQTVTQMSETTYWRGMNELIAKGFLAASHLSNIYWINPDFIWNGDRLAFVKEYYKKGSQAAIQLQEEIKKQRQQTFLFSESELSVTKSTETEEEYYAEIRQRLADVKAGKNIVHHDLIEVAD